MSTSPENMRSKDGSAFALEDALSCYGIRTIPFPIGHVDDFYFATPELARQHDVLRNLVEYGDLLLVVSGVEGAGKTAFLRSFLLAPGERWRCCRVDAHADMSRDALVDALLRGFGIETRAGDSAGNESLVQAHLAEIRASGGIAVVAVDDAHLLCAPCVEYLLGLAERRADLELQLLLAAEPGTLGFSTADTKRVHVVVLKPFDVQQCADYVNTRLSRAGLAGDSPFDTEVVEGIHADSGGIPGSIHPLALHTLLANADTPRRERRMGLSPRTLAYAAAVMVAVGAITLMLRPEPSVDGVTAPGPAASGRIEGIAALTDEARGNRRAQSRRAVDSPAPPDAGGAPQAEPPVDERASTIGPRPRGEPTPGLVAARSVENQKTSSLDETSREGAAALSIASTTQPDKRVTMPDGDTTLVRLAKNVTPTTTPTPVPSTGAGGDDWLARQDPSHFVLQLVGTRNAAAARGFLERHGLAGDAAWLTTSHDGKPWYVVVYGVYPDRAAARAAIATLPPALRATEPWPRSVASLAANPP